MLGQIGRTVPAGDDLIDAETLVLADGDQRLLGDERGDLTAPQHPGDGVQTHGMGGHEQVRVVTVELGPLPLVGGVLDGQIMQSELQTTASGSSR